MAQKAKCSVVKKTAGMKAAAIAGPTIRLATGVFQLLDGGSGTFTTMGVNQAGEQVAIDSVATETVTSDNPSLIVGTPAGMAVSLTPPTTGSGTAQVTWIATWNDGSVGPFTFTATVNWDGGKITGITVNQNP